MMSTNIKLLTSTNSRLLFHYVHLPDNITVQIKEIPAVTKTGLVVGGYQ